MINIKDLTIEDLKVVFENNQKLQEEVFYSTQDDANCLVGDFMSCFEGGAIDYNIGYPGNYITILNPKKFADGLFKLQKEYQFFSIEQEKLLKKYRDLSCKYNTLFLLGEEKTRTTQNELDQLLICLKDELLKELVGVYTYYYDQERLYEYFIETFYETMTPDFFVDENYILYQNVKYKKCYK